MKTNIKIPKGDEWIASRAARETNCNLINVFHEKDHEIGTIISRDELDFERFCDVFEDMTNKQIKKL